MKYCKYCGKEIENGAFCSCPESAKQNKIKLAIIMGAAALAIILALLICLACLPGTENPSPDPSTPSTNNGETNSNTPGEEDSTNGNNTNGSSNNNSTGSNGDDNTGVPLVKIDPFDYMEEPVIAGANKEATFSISLDKDRLAQALAGPEPTSDTYEAWSQWLSAYDLYYQHVDNIRITCSKTTNLENGNVILVEVSIPDVLGDKIKNATKTYFVSDLIDLEYYNFFDNITVTFEGMSGNAMSWVMWNTDSDVLRDCIFIIEPQYNLSNGDVVTVSIYNADYLKSEYYVVPEELSRDYVVSGLSAYPTFVSQLPIEDIEYFANRFYEDSLESLQSDDTYIYENIKYSGTYFYVSNNSDSNLNRPYKNFIEIVISYDYYVLGVDMGRTTASLYFTDVIIDSTGNITLSYEDGVESIGIIHKDYYDMTPIAITVSSD